MGFSLVASRLQQIARILTEEASSLETRADTGKVLPLIFEQRLRIRWNIETISKSLAHFWRVRHQTFKIDTICCALEYQPAARNSPRATDFDGSAQTL